ncbi:unnamed protein product [Dovyalis caffra]|uniref:Uncharacterized protein n=1 Tax=Dovyalis caffra TaxID=77055 RepID=A0AAV1S715_9ROSI|nr:unnamed protein product [Dovyalis caffra]
MLRLGSRRYLGMVGSAGQTSDNLFQFQLLRREPEKQLDFNLKHMWSRRITFPVCELNLLFPLAAASV